MSQFFSISPSFQKGQRPFWLLVVFLAGLFLSLTPVHTAHAVAMTVTTAVDVVANNGACSLREALINANNNNQSGSTDCPAGTGNDSINFAPSLNGVPITLSITGTNEDAAADGDLDISIDNLRILGNGVNNTLIDATGLNERVFHILAGANRVQIVRLTIQGGVSPGSDFTDPDTWGGGILSAGTLLTLDRVRITGNTAGTRGGGIYISGGSATMGNSTVDANTSGTSGGGVFVDGEFSVATLTFNNSTLSGNNAGGFGGGLAVYQNGSSATTTLNYVTVANNQADSDNSGGETGGGISNIPGVSGVLNIQSTLIADNSLGSGSVSGSHCSGPITTQLYNLIEDITGCSITLSTGDMTGDPSLVALADNGGQTPTHALGFSSIVIDQIPNGTNTCGTAPNFNKDQRGVVRPVDSDGIGATACESGAYEAPRRICSIGAANTYVFDNVSYNVQTLGDINCLQAEEIPFDHPNATAPLQNGVHWQLGAFLFSGQPASGYSIDLTISVPFTADVNDKLCRYTGVGIIWDCVMDSFLGTTITRNNVTQLSPWPQETTLAPPPSPCNPSPPAAQRSHHWLSLASFF